MKHTPRIIATVISLAMLLTGDGLAVVPAECAADGLSASAPVSDGDFFGMARVYDEVLDSHEDAPDPAYTESEIPDKDSPASDTDRKQMDGADAPAAKLPAPKEFAVIGVSSDSVRFSFSEVEGACGYALYYSTDSSFSTSISRTDADADSLTATVGGLLPGQTYCFRLAAMDSSGAIGDESAMVSATTGAVSLAVEVDGSTISNGEILDWSIGKPLSVACTNLNGNGRYLVRAFVTASEPSFDKTDMDRLATGVANGGTGFYYGSEDGDDELSESSIPFDFTGCAAGQYVKIWIAAEDANHSANGYTDSIQFAVKLTNAKSSMDWNCCLTSTSVRAGGMVCVKLRADRVKSFRIEIDGTGVSYRDVFDAGVRNRLASICLRVPEDTPDGRHTVTIICSESYATDDPGAAKEMVQLEFTVGKLPLSLQWPFHEDHTVGQHFGARDVSRAASNASTGHNGIDIPAKRGTKVYASAAGTVEFSGWGGSSGNWVQIAHENGVSTVYKHLKQPSALRVGDTVEEGDLVGYVGSTGISSGNHLHFGVLLNGEPVDPLCGYIMPNSVRTINFYTLKK